MTSTTAGTVFNNAYSSGQPTIPSSPTAFSTTGPGAFTRTAAATVQAHSVTVPGLAMGINGCLRSRLACSANNSAGNKTYGQRLSGQALANGLLTTNLSGTVPLHTFNQGVYNKQRTHSGNFGESQQGSIVVRTVDTAVATTFETTCNLAVATDYMILNYIICELLPKS
jgi:hypothetical protein